MKNRFPRFGAPIPLMDGFLHDNVHRHDVDNRLLAFLLMRALRRVMTWLLTVKTMNTQLTSVRSCRGYRYQFLFLLLLGTWWFGPCGTWPSAVVVGWPSSLLAYVLRPVVPLVISWVPSVGVKVVAIVVTTIILIPIVIIVVTVVVVAAIVVIAVVIVVVKVVVILPVAVIISISFAGTWSLAVSGSWSSSCWRLRSLWLDLSDGRGIAVE